MRSPSTPQPVNTSSVCWPGQAGSPSISAVVRLNRGAGAGWVTPPCSTKVPRSTLWGWAAASLIVRTGAKQTSVCSMISHHSSRVLPRKISVSRSLSGPHSPWSICLANCSSSERPVRRRSSE